ncbi:AAA family ATPase [Lentzea sp. NPDC004782]|uniref:ATP-binding protein n=1 Tax=Lentzea sp. NPDC004782 TaxID=3154458 RepID=UPI00339EE680
MLVGRASEVAALRAAFDRTLAGRLGVVLVSGEAGIGKSELVSAVVRDLPGDPLVLAGGCLELGADGAPYATFVAVLRELVRRLGHDRVVELLPRDGTALGDWLPSLGPAPAGYGRTRLLEEVLGLLAEVARAHPLVLVVEDLHWADASSRELFAYLARNLTGSAVLMIGTVRTGELAAGHPNRRLLAELGRRVEVTRVELGPLARADVAALLTAIDGLPPDPARAARIHRRSGGNPLFVEALAGAGETPAEDLRTLLLDRTAALPAPAREALATLAVAGRGLTDDVLAAVGPVVDELQAALSDLVGHGLVVAGPDGYAIKHDLIKEAVYGALLPAQRRRLHARCAEHGTDGVALAEHWLAAGEVGRAVPAALRAAAQAGRQNAYDEQLHLLELVLAQRTDDVDRVAVLEAAATAALAAGKSAAGIAHSTAALDELDAAADPVRVAALLGVRGQSRFRVDGTGRDDLERAVTLVPAGALRGSLLATLGFIGVSECRYDEARRAATAAVEIAGELVDDGTKARALLVIAALDGVGGLLESATASYAIARDLAEAAGDEHTYLMTFQWEAGLLDAAGHYARAAELGRIGQQAAERLGRSRSRGSMLANARLVPLRYLGEWDEAVRIGEDALAEDPPPLYGAFNRMVLADIARCRGERERFELLLRQLTEFARHSHGAPEAVVEIAIQRVAWALDTGALEQADHVLAEHLGGRWPARETLRLALLGARVQRARRVAAPRNRRVATETAARLAELSTVVSSVPDLRGLTAYHLTFRALTTEDVLPAWDRAVEAWRDLGDPYQTAVALTDAAACALASNNRPGASVRLREARALAAGLVAAPLLVRIDELADRGRIGAAGPVQQNDFRLTRREVDVLRVVARGRSNAEVAAELFISANTVATHVARILGKLQAATRTEAVSRARESGLLDR